VTPLRVVVAEGSVLLREALTTLLLRGGFDVVGQAGDGDQLLALVRHESPDLVVADIRLPPIQNTGGLNAARVIRQEMPDIGIALLSASVDDAAYAMKLMAGVPRIDYVLKGRITNVTDLFGSLESIAKGDSFVDSARVREFLAARRNEGPYAVLSSRELDVLALMAEGRSNGGISRRLLIAKPTVERHVSNILKKLSVPKTGDDHRRVLAVIAFLEAR
jgi:DNA-binding NarL/FixJ family response regulator